MYLVEKYVIGFYFFFEQYLFYNLHKSLKAIFSRRRITIGTISSTLKIVKSDLKRYYTLSVYSHYYTLHINFTYYSTQYSHVVVYTV